MKFKNILEKYKIPLIIFLFVVGYSFFLLNFLNIETDYLWHISAGKYMFLNNIILKKDVFSWILNNHYWMSHEWLFEYLIYFLKTIFGKYHVFIYSFICLSILFSILFIFNKNNFKNNIYFSLFWYSLSFIIFPFIQVRPHLLSFSFIALTIYLCFDLFNNKNSKRLYFLIPLAVLWSNFHGGSSNLVYIFPILFCIVGLFKFNLKKIYSDGLSNVQIKRFLFVALLSMLAICFNPHGIKMVFYPYSNMLDSLMINNISEWQSSSLNNPNHYMYYLLLVIIVFVVIFSNKKIRLIDFTLLCFVSFLGLKSIRFWFYTYIVCNFIIFYYIPDKKMNIVLLYFLSLISIIFILLFCFNFKNIRINNFKLSSDFINVIHKENPNRLYNLYDLGGELIYNKIPVFIDGRADLYSKNNYKDYLNICYLKGNYEKLISKYNFDYFIINDSFPIYFFIDNSDNYELIYKDNNYFMYKKKTL